MKKATTITINGRLYDAISGKAIKTAVATTPIVPVAPRSLDISPAASTVKPSHQLHDPAHAVHTRTQRSQTLNRQAITRPQAASHKQANTDSQRRLITRFAPQRIEPIAATSEPKPTLLTQEHTSNSTPIHPSVIKAMQARAAQHPTTPHYSSKELKEKLIKEQLAAVSGKPKGNRKNIFSRKPRVASILVSSLSLLLLAGYFSYINLTSISMQVAANRAGIQASFPNYKPDGYSISGPITYSPGEVNINYRSNASNSGFTLTQKATNWDSQGVLDNYVRKQTSTYLTFQDRGITVYTFSNKAAWTNGGLLYTVDGDAPLSSQQILRLATSL